MPASKQTRNRKSPKRDLLLDTAFRLFYLSGYHAVGIDTILAESGLAKMTLYHHFKSKDDLIVAALERRAAEIHEARSSTLTAAGDEPLARLSALFDAYETWFRSPDFNGCAFIRAIAEYPDESSKVNQAVKRQKQALVDALQVLAADFEVEDPASFALQLYLLAEGAIVRAHTFNDPQAATHAKAAALALVRSQLQDCPKPNRQP